MLQWKVVIAHRDLELIKELSFHLKAHGFEVIDAQDGEKALKLVWTQNPDIVLTDLILHQIDGIEVCKAIREQDSTKNMPIIVVTEQNEEQDKLSAFKSGVDDYITAPFSTRELIARMNAVLRRTQTIEKDSSTLQTGNITIDVMRHEIMINGEIKEFTPKEFSLLELLMSNAGKVFSRKKLLETIWGYEYPGDTRTVDVHIHHLRRKIESNPEKPDYIGTVRGVGYKFIRLE